MAIDLGVQLEALNELVAKPDTVPPDPILAVNGRWIVVSVNNWIRAYDRVEGKWVGGIDGAGVDLGEFLGTGGNPFDPWLQYDPDTHRFFHSAIATVPPMPPKKPGVSLLRLAYSSGNDDEVVPFGTVGESGAWQKVDVLRIHPGAIVCKDNKVRFDMRADQPKLAFDGNGWHLTALLTNQTQTVFSDIVVSYSRPEGDAPPIPVVRFRSDFAEVAPCYGANDDPMNNRAMEALHPVTAYGISATTYFIGIAGKSKGACPNGWFDTLRLYALQDPLDDKADGVSAEIKVDCFNGAELNQVPSPEGMFELGLDGRISSAVWREIDGTARIYACHAFTEPVDLLQKRTVIRWYKIRTNDWPVSKLPPECEESGTIRIEVAVPAVYLYLPTLAVNTDGDILFLMERSSLVERQSLQLAEHLSGDAKGRTGPLKQVVVSLNDFPGIPRWGDYTGLTLDPDGETFWGIGEYQRFPIGVGGVVEFQPDLPQSIWSTRVFSAKVSRG